MSKPISRSQLKDVFAQIYSKRRVLLDGLKEKAIKERSRPDFVWHRIIESFSTMGSSRGYEGLMENSQRYKTLTFESISAMEPSTRARIIEGVLRESNVRWPVRKAGYIVHNFQIVNEQGGPQSVTDDLWDCKGKKGKIKYLKQFKGIGDKQSRDIMMNSFDPDFQESVAVDSRIKRVCTTAGFYFDDFESQERFLVEIAHEIGISGWELDRLIYWFKDEILEKIE